MKETHHAPYQRAAFEAILQDYNEIRSLDYVRDLIKALPYIAIILNKERQIIFSGDSLLKKIGISMDEVLGLRPGEALKCVNARTMNAGCGTAERCQVCGAVNTVLKCQETGKTATDECRIRVHDKDGHEYCLDLEVTAVPFHWNSDVFYIVAARDISSEKRKEALERIFFHDVINTAGALQGVVDLLKQLDDPAKITEFIDLLSVVSQDLTEEILNQKSLLAAENGELVIRKQDFYLEETLHNIVREFQRHELALNKEIHISEMPEEVTIHTDPVLLKRVISNMVKNALEAIKPEERITIRCRREQNGVLISVHNPGGMPVEVRQQVFQRSFSTKGKGRGLGTYSMKLLGEKYLDGKIWFTSSKREGTEFCLELPLK
jgi:nitrogen-specific signal transduction histidine kinase